MSGQYPGGAGGMGHAGSAGGAPGGNVGPGSMMQMTGHRGQFNPQQQQQHQMMNTINQMGAAGMPQNPMPTTGHNTNMMQMGGYSQSNMMSQQTQPNQMQQPGGGMAMGQVGMANPMGMQSPSHIQQQMMQMQQQQMNVGAPGMNVGGPVGIMQHQHNVVAAGQPQMPPSTMQQQHVPASNIQPQQHGSSNMLANVTISQPNPHKEINIVALSRLGQETVQDITSRFQEIFGALKIIQPSSNRDNNTEKKVQEYFRTIRLLFKRVRIIYEKCNDNYSQEFIHVESLIPFKDDIVRNEALQCDDYRKALQENQELIETVKLKNRQLREIIDRTRVIIWEINTMLSMRRS